MGCTTRFHFSAERSTFSYASKERSEETGEESREEGKESQKVVAGGQAGPSFCPLDPRVSL